MKIGKLFGLFSAVAMYFSLGAKHVKANKGFLVSSLLALATFVNPGAVFSDSLAVLGKFNGANYAYEVELILSAFTANTVSIQQSGNNIPLFYDSGEGQWDVEADDLTFSQLDSFLSQGFDLVISEGANTSVYSVTTGTLTSGDIPTRASSLSISTLVNPTRPTATWSGGDANADFLFLTFKDINGNEFGDQITPVTAAGSYTLQQDLAPGSYEATLGYWGIANTPADTFAVSLVSGSNVFTPDPNETGLVGVGETLSNVSIVPVPTAGLLFATGLLGLIGVSKRK